MYTVNLKVSGLQDIATNNNNQYEYYAKLIQKEFLDCLNSNGISYVYENNNKSSQESQDQELVTITIEADPSALLNSKFSNGVYIFFGSGNPESKRMAEVLKNNMQRIYPQPERIKTISLENVGDPQESSANIILSLGKSNNNNELSWIRDNLETITQTVLMSLCEYFAIPYAGCGTPKKGTANSYANIFSKPSTVSKINSSISPGESITVQNQWEDWYIVGENMNLGYVQTKFINI